MLRSKLGMTPRRQALTTNRTRGGRETTVLQAEVLVYLQVRQLHLRRTNRNCIDRAWDTKPKQDKVHSSLMDSTKQAGARIAGAHEGVDGFFGEISLWRQINGAWEGRRITVSTIPTGI